ncbi:hypothetical protein [Pseudomonas sp. 1152_12]|uniref:hypothetical protein n=1 Tax=Pseudomonas sp. 1152_12 TaxID=2604455 RepID=UPI0040634358
MTLEAIFAVLCVAVPTVFAVLIVYLLICWLRVWKKQSPADRYGEIYWKKVDYFWIAIGSLGLLVQLVQTPVDLKVGDLNMQESIKKSTSQNVNVAAARLSDSSICLPPSGYINASVTAALAEELKKACDEFQRIRPANPTSIELDNKVNIYMVYKRLPEAAYKSPVVTERIVALQQAWATYRQQDARVGTAYAEAEAYKSVVVFMKFISLGLLGFAVALRMAKVTAEIKLKNDSVKKKSESEGGMANWDEAARELKVSANELKRSAHELSASAGKINNAVGEVKSASLLDALETRLMRMEIMNRRNCWIIGGAWAVFCTAVFFLQRAVAFS